ncbi:MAG: hypothetical protein HMLKMBBP_01902 [Planctomycetes bacterium]|nr:hypothetical protein [Planctomycetota bacterium]
MKRVFVCSPYRGDVAANVEIARAACREVLRQGGAPFAPHLLYPDLLDDDVPAERALGIEAGRRWLAMSHEILVVGPVTAGMREEIATAEALGIPVRYAAPPATPRVREPGGLLAWLRGVLPGAWEDRAALAAIALVVLGFLLCPGR